MKPSIPKNEAKRLQALRTYHILDTPQEPQYDKIAHLAKTICNTSIAIISMIDRDRMWIKASVGLDAKEIKRDDAFCSHTILSQDITYVEDMTQDPRFNDNLFVTGEAGLRFYAGYPLMSKDGEAIGSICVVDTKKRSLTTDQINTLKVLSEQVMLELELTKSNRQLKSTVSSYTTLLDGLRGVVFHTDEFGRWLYLNSAWEELTGFKVADTLKKSAINFIHPDDREVVYEQFKSLKANHVPLRTECRYLTKSGGFCWVEADLRPRHNDEGENVGCTGILHDITERKLLEVHAQQVAASSKFAALGEMAVTMAHEINNPLTIINSYAQLLANLPDSKLTPESARETSAIIMRTVTRIAKIIVSLRGFARDNSNDPMTIVPLNQILNETLDLCVSRFERAGVKLYWNGANDHLQALCRPGEIMQILVNLLNNSIDAIEKMDERWVKIESEDLGEMISISVTDSGKGIPESILEKVMIPFFTTKGVGNGLGLGLSLSKTIIEAYGGKLTIDRNSPNTKFIVCLPKKFAPAEAAA